MDSQKNQSCELLVHKLSYRFSVVFVVVHRNAAAEIKNNFIIRIAKQLRRSKNMIICQRHADTRFSLFIKRREHRSIGQIDWVCKKFSVRNCHFIRQLSTLIIDTGINGILHDIVPFISIRMHAIYKTSIYVVVHLSAAPIHMALANGVSAFSFSLCQTNLLHVIV